MANLLAVERREMIVDRLREERSVSIEALAREFGVSMMTIHRDIDRLEMEGRARKVRGGVMAAEIPQSTSSECAMCGKRVPRRTAWVITSEEGEQWQACCAHCGLLRLAHATGRQSVLATDFLYGRMVNAYLAAFVLGSDVDLCCVPGVLCFATRHDAERFRRGFGGELLDFAGALAAVSDSHHGH